VPSSKLPLLITGTAGAPPYGTVAPSNQCCDNNETSYKLVRRRSRICAEQTEPTAKLGPSAFHATSIPSYPQIRPSACQKSLQGQQYPVGCGKNV
jgi:hypothetical protein